MQALAPLLNIVTTCLYLVSIVILVWGVVLSVRDFLLAQLGRADRMERPKKLQETKNSLGAYILLSLEILIVADIIETIVRPTMEDIIRLGAIVAIRTVISYFLNKEIHESDRIKLQKKQ
ncbi:MAG: DUF1622 domain-containing protein [Christensenella sp.]|nr:DUF1622 domain-containing protein [Christensenella sp.]